ncbi:MAG: multicopper oxidase domain-containing protein, partial [Mycobacteriales bacterium]
LVAIPEGKDQPAARAVLRTGTAATPPADALPAELSGRLLSYADLAPAAAVALPPKKPDREMRFDLGLMMNSYRWTINGRTHDSPEPFDVRMGERVRLTFANGTGMFHPMHVHGHTFALTDTGVRKDTVIVLPGRSVSVDVQADNPGQWMVHCHNAYHLAGGMATMLSYVT